VLEHTHEGWEGEVGYITRDVLNRHLPEDRASYQYFMSGPLPMLRAVERALVKAGVPLSRLESERYEMA